MPMILDVETYRNYFLVLFKEIGSDKTHCFELYDGCDLDEDGLSKVMRDNMTVGFNSNHYDLYMIAAALQGFDNAKLKMLSDKIILSKQPAWRSARVMDVEIPRTAYSKPLWKHIDLIDVAPGKASLKIYGGRLNAPKLQDLPIDPSADISPSQRDLMRTYCLNDLETTELLHKALSKDLSLRVDMSKQYRVDLRSMGGAQVAKAVLQSELSSQGVSVSKPKSRAGDRFKYVDPGFISFSHPVLMDAFDRVKSAVFKVKDNGQVQMPETLDAAVEFMGGKYKFGIGGLHSQEKCQSVVCDDNHILAERDVASMYPNIILGQGMYPKTLGPKFLDVYNTIVQRRLKAKHGATKCTEKLRKLRAEIEAEIEETERLLSIHKSESDQLKLIINSSFGLFGSKYAFLYAPELMIQTTITGQLVLLMLIERAEAVGAKVVSANTDGVVTLCPKDRYAEFDEACFDWEMETGLELEETRYSAIHSRDVNSYIAVQTSGSVKGKGAFADSNMMKNPQFQITAEALKAYLSKGTPIEQTIHACSDVTKFLMVRGVTGGGLWKDEYLGKAVRFYYSKDVDQDTCIRYVKSGNKVPISDGCKPMMQLVDAVPADMDRARYIAMTYAMLRSLGVSVGA